MAISVLQVHAPVAERESEIIFPAIFGFPFKVHVIALVAAPSLPKFVTPMAEHAPDEVAVKPT